MFLAGIRINYSAILKFMPSNVLCYRMLDQFEAYEVSDTIQLRHQFWSYAFEYFCEVLLLRVSWLLESEWMQWWTIQVKQLHNHMHTQ